jgi:diguanylate cyclase (GGDEF)-like protein
VISLKRYLDSASLGSDPNLDPEPADLAFQALAAYSSALETMGLCSLDACPALGSELSRNLCELSRGLAAVTSSERLAATDNEVQQQLQGWGRSTARHYRQKSDEVKQLLLVMVHTAESVGARDQRCAGQIHEVTARLQAIASLDDITQIRASIEKSAAELKLSIDRMTEEGKSAIDQLQQQASTYRAKLEEAEQLAFRDALTGLRSRLCLETLIDRHIAAGTPFCVAIVDIDEFKKVNDDFGHPAGDAVILGVVECLRCIVGEQGVIGRIGGEEFTVVLPRHDLADALQLAESMRSAVCSHIFAPPVNRRITASFGVSVNAVGTDFDTGYGLADAALYRAKRGGRNRVEISDTQLASISSVDR